MNSTLRSQLELPRIRDLSSLASEMNVEYKFLNRLIDNDKRNYRTYTIPKKSGGERRIDAPSYALKAVQYWILDNILLKLQPHLIATAFRQGQSIGDNARRHQNHRYYFFADIENFFPSISIWRVESVFRRLGYSADASILLSKLCCFQEKLPQGGVTSPHIANLIGFTLDKRLHGLASKFAFIVTRYADDIVFSSNNPKLLKQKVSLINKIITSEGFRVNQNKVTFRGPNDKVSVTGLLKNCSAPTMGVGREMYRLVRSLMHKVANGNKLHGRYDNKAKVEGLICHIHGVDALAFEKLRAYALKINYNNPIFIKGGNG